MMKILSLSLMFVAIPQVFSCTCMPNGHIQRAFCRSKFVIHGKAIKLTEPKKESLLPVLPVPSVYHWQRNKIYDVQVIEVFKAPSDTDIKPGDIIQAVTNGDGGLCGGSLWLDHEQLITGGENQQGQITFGLCSYRKDFSHLTVTMLEGLRGAYSCECPVLDYWGVREGVKGCRIHVIPGYNEDCLLKYGRCLRDANNKCIWDVEEHEGCVFTPLPI